MTREALVKKLKKRYNMSHKSPKEKKVELPFTKSSVRLTCYDAKDVIQSLLTDPCLTDDDYLFYDDNPFGQPPDVLEYVGDLNTGEAYRATHRTLISDPQRQVLLPVVFYIDGAVTGQFENLQITALKMSLGIFKRTTRDKDWTWGTLGYVATPKKETSQGKRLFMESQNMEAQDMTMEDKEGAGSDSDSGPQDNEMVGTNNIPGVELNDNGSETSKPDPIKAQDYHTMLSKLLQSYVDLQNTGFLWDLPYKGEIYKVEFVLFCPFVKCDTEEGDKNCGKYLSRQGKVAHLCRHCHCPSHMTDDYLAKYPWKTQPKIEKLIRGKRKPN